MLGWRITVVVVGLLFLTLVTRDCLAKATYSPASYPLLRKEIENFDARLTSTEDMKRYGLMHNVATLLSTQDSNTPLFQESKTLLMQMWHDDYRLIAEQSLQTFISEGIIIVSLK